MEMEGEEENKSARVKGFQILAGGRSDFRQLSSRSLGKSHANSTRCPSLRATG